MKSVGAHSEPSLPVSCADVHAAVRLLEGKEHRTPVLTSRTVDARTGAWVFFKCENLQRGGAFKFRGAYNATANLSDGHKRNGVVAYSSHIVAGQGTAAHELIEETGPLDVLLVPSGEAVCLPAARLPRQRSRRGYARSESSLPQAMT